MRKKQDKKSSLVKISELARLAGVTTSTIKFYMAEGLLPEPALRTSRNMAYYDPALASRIRTIKHLQQEHFIPLKRIGEVLEPAPSALVRHDLAEETDRWLQTVAPSVHAQRPASLTRGEVIDQFGISESDLGILDRLGLGSKQSKDDTEAVYKGAELEILQVIADTREKELGSLFPMDIFEPYTKALTNLVQTEIDLFRNRLLSGALQPTEKPIEEVVDQITRLSERLIVAIRSKLILTILDKMQIQNLPPTSR